MELILSIVFLLFATILGIFCSYQFFFFTLSCIANIFCKKTNNSFPPKNRFGIIIPAHNEELLIGDLIQSIQESSYPDELCEVLVIADNCTDGTAEISKKMGAQCFVRSDDKKRGKPYALNWLIAQLNLNEFDAFIILDADTIIDAHFLAVMNDHLCMGEKVLQGYFGVSNPNENWLTRLSILPGILKFKLHFPGKNLLHLSCPLAGNGMCFRTEIFQKYGWNAFSLVENWQYYLMLALEGYTVVSVENAIIYSQVTKSLRAGKTQRVRWSKGRMQTLLQYWPAFWQKGILQGDMRKIDALIEILRPSHSILLFLSVLYAFLLMVFRQSVTYYYPFIVSMTSFIIGSQLLYFTAGLIIQKPPLKTWLALFMVPVYIVWKVFVTLVGIVTFRNKKWVRTERHK